MTPVYGKRHSCCATDPALFGILPGDLLQLLSGCDVRMATCYRALGSSKPQKWPLEIPMTQGDHGSPVFGNIAMRGKHQQQPSKGLNGQEKKRFDEEKWRFDQETWNCLNQHYGV